MRPGKKPKNTEAPSAAEMDDLQDDVLPSIVSFLPAHDAVRTCVLARRWRHVWTSATALRITAVGDFRSADKFNRFVDRLLSLRRHAHPPLESCEFDLVEKKFGFGWFLSVQHVYRHSLQSALDCNVKVLRCCFTPTKPSFAHSLPEPAEPLLSQHIQKLELSHIRAALDFSGCPVLVNLKMRDCITLDDNMAAPSLERIVRLGECSADECFRSVRGCSSYSPCQNCHLAIDFSTTRGRSYFFEGLSRATHLQLSATYDHSLIFQRDLSWRPTFPMLKTLVLDDWCLDDDLSEVILFIQQSPNLEKLTLELVEDFDSSMAIEGNYRSWDGTFASDHLKMVEIKCEKVDERINKVLKILSTFGISLEKIYIRQTDTSSGSECFHFVCTCISLN
ncbi:hypothetical protein ACQ4PT_059540 [Festuca glaucescens]